MIPAPSPLQSTPVRVLVVDDDPLIHVIFKKVAGKVDGQVAVDGAMQPVEGLKKFQTHCPDMLFLDINMPGMNGWEFLEKLGPTPEACKVFIFSSSIDPSDREKAKTYRNVRDYVVKPITTEKLRALM